MLCGIILAAWTIWGNTALMVNAIVVSSNRIPAAFSGFRIAQVSDLHNAEFGDGNAELLNLLEGSRPGGMIRGNYLEREYRTKSEKL